MLLFVLVLSYREFGSRSNKWNENKNKRIVHLCKDRTARKGIYVKSR